LDISKIVGELKKERDRLGRAITALEGAGGAARKGAAKGPGRRKRRGRLTPEGRRRLSEAMKKRWA